MDDKTEDSVNKQGKRDDKKVKSDGERALLAKRRRSSEDARPAAKRRRHNSRNFKNEGKWPGRKHKKKSAEFTFHLGGSISDPLNLEGLSGSGHDCTTCPPSPSSLSGVQQQPSPLPPHRRHDPLNLEGAQNEGQHVDKPKKRKRSKSTRARSVSKGPDSKAVLSDDAFQGPSKSEDQSKKADQPPTNRVPDNGTATSTSDDLSSSLSAKLKKGKNEKFRYGNYNRYYGYRNSGSFASDSRLKLMKKEWFEGKTALDIGCNTGQVTIEIARKFNPKTILGVDIDGNLIKTAKKNVIRVVPLPTDSRQGSIKFPTSFAKVYGPIALHDDVESNGNFPNNIRFKEVCYSRVLHLRIVSFLLLVQENFVPVDDASMEKEEPKYNVILALSLTKWVHLNWGDSGIKRMFKRVYSSLLPGGMFILEPQPFSSYDKKKYLTVSLQLIFLLNLFLTFVLLQHEIFQNYSSMSFMPEEFSDYLLSPEVGFVECLPLGTPDNPSKGTHA